MCRLVSTASAQRSFSTMNGIINKIRNRMGLETLQFCTKKTIKGPIKLEEKLVNDVIDDLYA